MKRALCLLVVVVCLIGCKKSLEPTGYGGMKWDTLLSNDLLSDKGLKVVGTKGDVSYCMKKKAELFFEGVPVQSITYLFYKGYFYSAEIKTRTFNNFNSLWYAVNKLHGLGWQDEKDQDYYYWTFPKSWIQMRMRRSDEQVTLTYIYIPTDAAREWDLKRAKK